MIGGVLMPGLRVGKVQFDYDPEIRPHRLVRSGRQVFILETGVRIPLGSLRIRSGRTWVRPEPAMRVT